MMIKERMPRTNRQAFFHSAIGIGGGGVTPSSKVPGGVPVMPLSGGRVRIRFRVGELWLGPGMELGSGL